MIIFSSFIILGFTIGIIGLGIALSSTDETSSQVDSGLVLVTIGNVLMTVSIIGTFVTSILVVVKASALKEAKGITRATGIVGIIFVWAVSGTKGTLLAFIMIIVTFGLSCASYKGIKKANGFIDNQNQEGQTQSEQVDKKILFNN